MKIVTKKPNKSLWKTWTQSELCMEQRDTEVKPFRRNNNLSHQLSHGVGHVSSRLKSQYRDRTLAITPLTRRLHCIYPLKLLAGDRNERP